MRIALAQMVSGADPEANLAAVEKGLEDAVRAGASLVAFPEAAMCAFGNPLADVAEPLDGPWVSRFAALADRHGVLAVAGTFTPTGEKGPDGRAKVANVLVAAGPDGVTGYQKIHLYDAFGFAESDTVVPGTAPALISHEGIGIGLATCYDVRFPALFTTLADRGAELVVVAASWAGGAGKLEQWRLLTRARALDSTCFVAAVGQADPSAAGGAAGRGAPTGIGHSAVIDPTGQVIAEAGAAPELLVADIDLARVPEVRKALPVLANRRVGGSSG
ncbi:carbon-nitrogen hydrolase family protein [Streptomyces odontomachi]|uniref:carbon-nitrogen hydrolase family protein n=1 Tax=Streptomyces odontomachi TaxID=2944940 RepID=UPI00210DF460|nr:carbon-nitrogen hydrolase family protein [Streptomyces sp. ODS25]